MTGDEDADGLAGPVLTGMALRLGLLAVAVVLVLVVTLGRPTPVWWVVALLLVAGGAAAAPGTLVPGFFLSAMVVVQLLDGVDDVGVRVAAAVVAFYAVHLLAALAAVVPTPGRVEVAALVPSAARAAVVVPATLVVLTVVAVIPADEAPPWVLGVLALAAAVVVCLPAVVVHRDQRPRR